jgi:hypothetical protein
MGMKTIPETMDEQIEGRPPMEAIDAPPPSVGPGPRVDSVDVLRGLTI